MPLPGGLMPHPGALEFRGRFRRTVQYSTVQYWPGVQLTKTAPQGNQMRTKKPQASISHSRQHSYKISGIFSLLFGVSNYKQPLFAMFTCLHSDSPNPLRGEAPT